MINLYSKEYLKRFAIIISGVILYYLNNKTTGNTMDIKDYTTSALDDILSHRADWVEGADVEFEARSAKLNAKLDSEASVTLSKEEVDNGDYKACHPDYVRCDWQEDGTLVLSRDCFVATNYYH